MCDLLAPHDAQGTRRASIARPLIVDSFAGGKRSGWKAKIGGEWDPR